MERDTLTEAPDGPASPVGRVNERPDEPEDADEPVEPPAVVLDMPETARVRNWTPMAIPLGVLALAVIVGALIFILQVAYEPAGY